MKIIESKYVNFREVGTIKTLVVVGHPQLADSGTQQFLKVAAELPTVTWHPVSEPVAIEQEQQLLQQADRIILQFPLYWYSAPALLKNWLDQVLTRQFAYPAAGGNLVGKSLGIVVTLGSPARQFKAGGDEQFTISELMAPFQALANKLKMNYLPTFVVDQFGYQSETEKAKLLIDYQRYLTQAPLGHFKAKSDWLIEQLQLQLALAPAEQQQQLNLILTQLQSNQDELDDLQANLKLVQDMEDD